MSVFTSELSSSISGSSALPDWKEEVSAKLRAHRNRHSRVPENQPALPGMEPSVSHSTIAARVAERYSRVPSYRDMLAARAAAEAEAAAKAAAEAEARARAETKARLQAEAAKIAEERARIAAAQAAEVAQAAEAVQALARAEAISAAEVVIEKRSKNRKGIAELFAAETRSEDEILHDVGKQLRDALNSERWTEGGKADGQKTAAAKSDTGRKATAAATTVVEPLPYQSEPVRYSVSTDSLPPTRSTPAQARVATAARLPLPDILDPMEEATVEPTRMLPARVIEFPRELIAPRKARPRLAEGPLREEDASAEAAAPSGPPPVVNTAFLESLFPPEEQQAPRIMEAEPETGEAAPLSATGPEWHSIHLDADGSSPVPQSLRSEYLKEDFSLQVAPLSDRIMAAVVDVALSLAAFLVFVGVFAACTPHPPAGKVAAAGAGLALLALFLLYEYIFFSVSGATLGMRYAKIALCSFEDDNPPKSAVRLRIAALLLSALPLGLGFLWAAFDEDSLSWHDRITQTYQRSYRPM